MGWHPGRESAPCHARRRGSPWPARRDRPVPVGPRAVGPICVKPTLPALSRAATRPHTAGRGVTVPMSRRPWAAIGCCASPPPCITHTVDGRDPLHKARAPIKGVKLPAARIAQTPSRHCHRQWCPRRAPPSSRLHRQRVLLLPALGSPVAPPFACCSGRATSSPEQSSQRRPPPASATPDRRSPLRRE
jgi:hypothetical protein